MWSQAEARHRTTLALCHDARIPSYGQITGTDQGVEGSWFMELNDDGSPVSEFEFIPIEAMPDIVPVWSIALPISGEAGIAFSGDEAANLTIITMLRSLAELTGLDAES
jgi:hypothetical protein